MSLRLEFKEFMRRKATIDPELKAALLEEASHQDRTGDMELGRTFRSLADVQLRPATAIGLHSKEICRIVENHHCRDPRWLGAARAEDIEDSDLDIVLDATDATLFDIAAIERQISTLTGVCTHIYTLGQFPGEKRGRILAEAQPIHEEYRCDAEAEAGLQRDRKGITGERRKGQDLMEAMHGREPDEDNIFGLYLADIDNNPQNGKRGIWCVTGIRHGCLVSGVSSASEAWNKAVLAGAVGEWELFEIKFIGELPEVFRI